MPRWLFALLFAALILYTDDYVIAGILPELAGDLGCPRPKPASWSPSSP